MNIRAYVHKLADNFDPDELRRILHNFVDFQPPNTSRLILTKLSKYAKSLPEKLNQDIIQSICQFHTPFEQSTLLSHVSKCFQKAVYSNLSQFHLHNSQNSMAWIELREDPFSRVPPKYGQISKWTDDYYKALPFGNTFSLSILRKDFNEIAFERYLPLIRNLSAFGMLNS